MCNGCEKRFAALEVNMAEIHAEWSCHECGRCTFKMGADPYPPTPKLVETITSVDSIAVGVCSLGFFACVYFTTGLILKAF